QGERKVTTTLEDTIAAIRENGSWKLRLPEFASATGKEPSRKEQEQLLSKYKVVADKLAKQIRDGKYPTREAASFAFASELYRMIGDIGKAAPPPEKTKKQ